MKSFRPKDEDDKEPPSGGSKSNRCEGARKRSEAKLLGSRGSAIDARTTRDSGYQVSQRIRKRVEETFGWMKQFG